MSIRELFNSNQHDLYCKDLTLSGNLNMSGDITMDEIIVTNTTNSVSSTTGSIRTLGGVGIAKDLYIGGNVYANNLLSNTSTTINSTMSGPWETPLTSRTITLTKTGNLVTVNYPISETGTVSSSQYFWSFPTSLPSGYYNTNRVISCPIAIENNSNTQMAFVQIAVDGSWNVFSPTLLTGSSGTTIGGFTITYSII